MTRTSDPAGIYDDFSGPEPDMSRWLFLEYPLGPDGNSWKCEEPNARTDVGLRGQGLAASFGPIYGELTA